MLSLSDKWFKPDYFDPADEDFKSGYRPSTSSGTRPRSDWTPSKLKPSTQKIILTKTRKMINKQDLNIARNKSILFKTDT